MDGSVIHANDVLLILAGIGVTISMFFAGYIINRRGKKVERIIAGHVESIKVENDLRRQEYELLMRTTASDSTFTYDFVPNLTPEVLRLFSKETINLTPEEFDMITDFICARGEYLVEMKQSNGELNLGDGDFVAIDVISSEYQIRRKRSEAAIALQSKKPGAQIYVAEFNSSRGLNKSQKPNGSLLTQ